MSAFRPRNGLFSSGQGVCNSLLAVDETGGTASEGIDLQYFSPQLPIVHLDRPPPHMDLVKDLPSKILEDLHHVLLYELCAGRATGPQSIYWAPVSQY